MCSREPSIRVKLSHVYLTQISFFPDIHRNLERTGNLRFSSHSSCWIQDFSIPVQLLLSLIQMLRSPCAFSEVWAVEPLEMDHWTDDGFDSSFLKNNKQKNTVVDVKVTQQRRKFPSKVDSAGRTVNMEHVPWQEGNAPAPPGFYSIFCWPFCTSTQQFLLLTMAEFFLVTPINADAINMSVSIS